MVEPCNCVAVGSVHSTFQQGWKRVPPPSKPQHVLVRASLCLAPGLTCSELQWHFTVEWPATVCSVPEWLEPSDWAVLVPDKQPGLTCAAVSQGENLSHAPCQTYFLTSGFLWFCNFLWLQFCPWLVSCLCLSPGVRVGGRQAAGSDQKWVVLLCEQKGILHSGHEQAFGWSRSRSELLRGSLATLAVGEP